VLDRGYADFLEDLFLRTWVNRPKIHRRFIPLLYKPNEERVRGLREAAFTSDTLRSLTPLERRARSLYDPASARAETANFPEFPF
jgi:hypothetical protein